jgi:hypothetical protein
VTTSGPPPPILIFLPLPYSTAAAHVSFASQPTLCGSQCLQAARSASLPVAFLVPLHDKQGLTCQAHHQTVYSSPLKHLVTLVHTFSRMILSAQFFFRILDTPHVRRLCIP